MALILIRALSKSKLLNSISDIERHAQLKILGKPKNVDSKKSDEIAEKILKQKIRTNSRNSALLKVKEDTTKSILNIKKIHPPGHLTVISEEYENFNELYNLFNESPSLDGYYSPKSKKSKKR
ncbi:MAG: DUF356 domain-containing protein [Methanomicrobiales archaeon]